MGSWDALGHKMVYRNSFGLPILLKGFTEDHWENGESVYKRAIRLKKG